MWTGIPLLASARSPTNRKRRQPQPTPATPAAQAAGVQPSLPQAERRSRSPRLAQRVPQMPTEGLTRLPIGGCREPWFPPGVRGSPPVSKNVGGWAGGTTAQAKPNPPLKDDAGRNKHIRPGSANPPIAKYERLCYNRPRKWAASPLRFLEACRRQEHWGTHSEPLRQRR